MGRNAPVRSERNPQHTPAERAARIRRCARAIAQGNVMLKDLRRVYADSEIEAAKKMLETQRP